MITIYTDGSYQSSISAGGYSAVVYDNGKLIKEFYCGHKNTTNNREELRGVIAALEYLDAETPAVIISDSQYVLNHIKYAEKWFGNLDDLDTKKNLDLWYILLQLYKSHPNVQYQWTKGHSECEGNIRADMLAVHAAQCLNIQTDFEDVTSVQKVRESLVPSSESHKSNVLDDWSKTWETLGPDW